MSKERNKVLQAFRLRRVIWPMLIGLGVLGYAVYRIAQEEINFGEVLSHYSWWTIAGWLGLGFLFMIVRDLGYTWRMRVLTDKQLSWRNALEVTLLWEFASALTPSVVGGSALAIFMLIKEKISAGRSTAIVFITIFLDELFYLIMVPLVVVFVGQQVVFGPMGLDSEGAFGTGLIVSFWIAYSVLLGYTLFLAFALFIHPAGTHLVFKKIFASRLLKRWRVTGFKMANDLLIASREYRTKSWSFWLKAWTATFAAWVGRYLVLNVVLAAFVGMTFFEHVVAFARQAVLFVVMIVSPTPGSSGVAEGVFTRIFQEFAIDNVAAIPALSLTLVMASLWRIISYYPYLFVGIPLLPRWLQRVYRQDPKAKGDDPAKEAIEEVKAPF